MTKLFLRVDCREFGLIDEWIWEIVDPSFVTPQGIITLISVSYEAIREAYARQ